MVLPVRQALTRLGAFVAFMAVVLVLYFALAAIGQNYNWMSRGTALIAVLCTVALVVIVGLLAFPMSDIAVEPMMKRAEWWVALLLAVYLVVFQAILVHLSIGVWLGPKAGMFPWLTHIEQILGDKFEFFQDLVLAACAAGLGGAVYMVREFYIMYCFGRSEYEDETDDKGKVIGTLRKTNYLQAVHMPRYVLLPFSALILGPIVFSLLIVGTISLQSSVGTISFQGAEGEIEIQGAKDGVSRPTIAIVCFLLGYAYHDTLKLMTKLSRTITGGGS